ncbi:MAG: histidine kinase [Muribaculaceae bacterium]|nr:histidine kinase [Muribaculaceae bacterium]
MNKPSRSGSLSFLIHLLILCILFVLPELAMSSATGRFHHDSWRFYAKALVYVAVFYTEYYAVMRGGISGQRRTIVRIALGSVAVLLIALMALWALHPARRAPHGAPEMPPPNLVWLIRDMAMAVLTMALAAALKMAANIHAIEDRRRELEEIRRTQELATLRSQLNPHFLFNALNTIYALTEIDSARSREAISTLGRLLRYTLYETDRPTVELGRELDFIVNYVSLMEMRLAGTVKVKLSIEASEAARTTPVAPMLFITLVENAFKHGLTGRPDAEIVIAIKATEAGAIDCRVVNHTAAAPRQDVEKGGVGLVNLRRRLQLIYGCRATLTVQPGSTVHCVDLTIRPEHQQN